MTKKTKTKTTDMTSEVALRAITRLETILSVRLDDLQNDLDALCVMCMDIIGGRKRRVDVSPTQLDQMNETLVAVKVEDGATRIQTTTDDDWLYLRDGCVDDAMVVASVLVNMVSKKLAPGAKGGCQ